MKLLNEMLEILNEALYKPMIADIGPHLALAGMSSSPKDIANILNKTKDLSTIEKEYNELTKRKPIESYATNKFDKKVHKLIVGIYWLKYHPSKKTIEDFLNVTGLDLDEVYKLASEHFDHIKQVFKDFKLTWIPYKAVKWSTEFTPEERKVIVSQEILNLSQGKPGSVAGIDLAKAIKHKYRLVDDEDSLRKVIDVILTNHPHLDKYRAVGHVEKSKAPR